MKYLLYIFDLDGTIIDSSLSISTAINDTLRHFGAGDIGIDDARKLIGYSIAPNLRKLGIRADDNDIMDVFRSFYFQYIDKYQEIFNGIPEMLLFLKNKILMSIITSKGRRGAELSLRKGRLFEYFDYLITDDDTRINKPGCESYEKIINCYRHEGKILEKGDVLMIGDSPVDCEFAANCGIDFAFPLWGFFALTDLPAKPQYILHKPSDLIEINGFNEVIEIETTEELDLHTYSPKDSSKLVKDYLHAAMEKGFSTVRIVHGKGKGIQRDIVRKILSNFHGVRSFYDAPPYLGGKGATIVELGTLQIFAKKKSG